MITSLFARAQAFTTRKLRQFKLRRQFRKEFQLLKSMSEAAGVSTPMPWDKSWALMNDRTATTEFDPHYTYFPAWAARRLQRDAPTLHVDISSTLHFATIISAFIPVNFYDYRPASLILDGLSTGKCDLTNLSFETGSIRSLSCMHVVEHIGLGRYGDALDPQGDMKAMKELARVLAPGGSLYFVVPVGEPVVIFNAHRIYSFRQVVEAFPGLSLHQFSLIPDDARKRGMIENASESEVYAQRYACGCFHFVKAKKTP